VTWSNGKGRGAKYDSRHEAQRKQWLQRTTPQTPCVRCGHPLGAQQRLGRNGRKVGLWHLDHTDDGLSYLGFSHGEACATCGRKCNVSVASAKAARITNARRKPVVVFVRPAR
jgi:hypothetical protein